jgi:hypothetical protein
LTTIIDTENTQRNGGTRQFESHSPQYYDQRRPNEMLYEYPPGTPTYDMMYGLKGFYEPINYRGYELARSREDNLWRIRLNGEEAPHPLVSAYTTINLARGALDNYLEKQKASNENNQNLPV